MTTPSPAEEAEAREIVNAAVEEWASMWLSGDTTHSLVEVTGKHVAAALSRARYEAKREDAEIIAGITKKMRTYDEREHWQLSEEIDRQASKIDKIAEAILASADQSPPQEDGWRVGDRVEKFTGDYKLLGEVRARFATNAGKVRYVVEHEPGFLHIYNGDQLRGPPAKDKG